ncbi:SPOR domain-containing protein [Chitinibacter bivalviorum]|uniref:SPOR domain-containing protein n=1 Tax=Chitinibacter bivalviorum TaxID=2739434 RepID=A0A7H9BNN1_9NEIS|nr:SPOR domain-containing protein [Chitinibacter bivalviorum]QLG88934.1 SPOR domain-containing protein [Chitinibacter bivalviorum]
MSRDMKPNHRSSSNRSSNNNKSGGGSLFTGLLVGLFIGIAIAVAFALFLNRSGNPFGKDKTTPNDMLASSPETATAAPEILHPGNGKESVAVVTTAPVASKTAASKPVAANASEDRFDFYKMLPEVNESPKAAPKEVAVASAVVKPKPSASATATAEAAKPGWIQAGAFQNENDADNMKAKLALIGVESRIQTTEVPEKGVWHRVRIGPFANPAELEKTRSLLKTNGIDSSVVKGN